MPALIVDQNGEVAREPHHDIAPDAEIGAQRIDEHQQRLVPGRADHLVVQRHVVEAGELHGLIPHQNG